MGGGSGDLSIPRLTVAFYIACPGCGEEDDLSGAPTDLGVELTCGSCGLRWVRGPSTSCSTCDSQDLQTVPLAIVEKSRGTQLSVVGTRPVTLCSVCDADRLEKYHANRPNPLMPDTLPTIGEEHLNG
jgi:hypothetical protein